MFLYTYRLCIKTLGPAVEKKNACDYRFVIETLGPTDFVQKYLFLQIVFYQSTCSYSFLNKEQLFLQLKNNKCAYRNICYYSFFYKNTCAYSFFKETLGPTDFV